MKTTTNIFKSRVQAHIITRLGNPWNEDTQSENENATTAERLENENTEVCKNCVFAGCPTKYKTIKPIIVKEV